MKEIAVTVGAKRDWVHKLGAHLSASQKCYESAEKKLCNLGKNEIYKVGI
jgi:hypothetical protein